MKPVREKDNVIVNVTVDVIVSVIISYIVSAIVNVIIILSVMRWGRNGTSSKARNRMWLLIDCRYDKVVEVEGAELGGEWDRGK